MTRSDLQKRAIPTTLSGVEWSQTFTSRDAAQRWFRSQTWTTAANVIQSGEQVCKWIKGPRGGTKVSK